MHKLALILLALAALLALLFVDVQPERRGV